MSLCNKAILDGHLGSDPTVRYTAQGKPVVNFSLATTERYRDKTTGEPKDETEWHRVVAFGKPAEVIGEHAKKGTALKIEGRLRTRKYTDKEGVERYTTEIVVEEFMFGPKKADGGTAAAAPDGGKADSEDDPPFHP